MGKYFISQSHFYHYIFKITLTAWNSYSVTFLNIFSQLNSTNYTKHHTHVNVHKKQPIYIKYNHIRTRIPYLYCLSATCLTYPIFYNIASSYSYFWWLTWWNLTKSMAMISVHVCFLTNHLLSSSPDRDGYFLVCIPLQVYQETRPGSLWTTSRDNAEIQLYYSRHFGLD